MSNNNSNEDVFMEITNKDIWDKIETSIETIKDLRDNVTQLKDDNKLGHQSIIDRQDYTNGKVKNNRRLIIAAFTIGGSAFMFLLGVIVRHLGG